ncbi:MAG: cytochrome b/b6 domain-containing protein [Chloroflexi bacterium]|nr:cytochrome b/b6 domain-containing protein [Chloroflexota bacterium]
MASESVRLIRRYVPAQRIIHWTGVITFLTLLLTGMALLVPPLSFLAAGGSTRLIHRIAVVPFVLLPLVYAVVNPKQARELLRESFTFTRDDLRWFLHMPAYFFGRTRGLPPQGRINAGQKLHHATTFLMFVAAAASGFVLMFAKDRLGADGLAIAASVHDLSMLGLTVMMIGHLYFTFLYDALNSMLTGFVTEEYARMEHPKWLEGLPANAFVVRTADENKETK